jgi:Family of unknown function (DUF5906)
MKQRVELEARAIEVALTSLRELETEEDREAYYEQVSEQWGADFVARLKQAAELLKIVGPPPMPMPKVSPATRGMKLGVEFHESDFAPQRAIEEPSTRVEIAPASPIEPTTEIKAPIDLEARRERLRREYGLAPLVVQRRVFGKPKLIEAKAEEIVEPIMEGEVYEPSKIDQKIAALKAELEEQQGLIITNQRKQLVTPALAAVKPEIAMREMNEKYAIITNYGGKCVVLEWVPSKVNSDWQEPLFKTLQAFREGNASRYVELAASIGHQRVEVMSPQPIAPWWLAQPTRRQYDGVDLEPKGPAILKGNQLNLWREFGVRPVQGDWSLMRRHMYEVLASSDGRSEEYILRWNAWKVQNPGERAEVALNYKGKKGSGKGVIMYAMLKIFGPHGMLISNREHLTGKHNKHLQNLLLLCADEAVWAGDKEAERTLKSLITELTMLIEPKGVDAFPWKNRLGIIQSTNEKWVVPATMDERRYAVFDVSERYLQKKEYFVPLFYEINNGGAEAMLYDLLRLDLQGWHPRYDIPQTKALADQKVQSLDGEYQWWLSKLNTGETPTPAKNNPRWVKAKLLWEECKNHNAKTKYITDVEFGGFLREMGCKHKSNGQAWGWIFPPIAEARRAWELRMGCSWEWQREVEEWNEK